MELGIGRRVDIGSGLGEWHRLRNSAIIIAVVRVGTILQRSWTSRNGGLSLARVGLTRGV